MVSRISRSPERPVYKHSEGVKGPLGSKGGSVSPDFSLFQNHEENLCPKYPVSCPNKCLQIIPRTEVTVHNALRRLYVR